MASMIPRLHLSFISALFALILNADAFNYHGLKKQIKFSRIRAPSVQTVVLANGGDFLSDLSSVQTVLLASGELSTPEVAGYFIFLSALIAVPFVGGTMDGFRIAEVKEKRQNFIDAIEAEIADLLKESTIDSASIAKV